MALIRVNRCATQDDDWMARVSDGLLFPPSQQSIVIGWSIFWNRQDREVRLRQIREAEFMCGSLRYIDYSSTDVRATIGDPDDCRTAVFSIFDEDQCFERKSPMRGGQVFCAGAFSACRLLAQA